MANDNTNNDEATKNGLISPSNTFILPEETSETVTTTSADLPLTNGLPISACTSPKITSDSFVAIDDVESSDVVNSMMDTEQGDEPSNGPKQYKCYICDKLFSRNSSLKCHIRLHLEGPVNILRKGSSNRLSNEAIMIEREDGMEVDPLATPNAVAPNEEGLYECHLCSRTFDRKKGLFRHIGYHNSSMEHTASRMDSLDDTGSDIELSLADENSLDHVGGPLYECVHCSKRFKTVRAMKIHSTHAHRESRPDDDDEDGEMDMEMEMSVAENSDEERHDEEEEERFECEYCGRAFHSQRARSIHFVHAHKFGDKTSNETSLAAASSAPKSNAFSKELFHFTCAFCNREFRTCRLMNAHIVDEHPDGESFQCVVCERRYDSIRAYGDHGRGICGKAQIQNGMYVYACEECPKTFAHPKSMSRHMREHRSEQDHLNHLTQVLHEKGEPSEQSEKREETGAKAELPFYKCAFCIKSYPNVKALAGHMKIHNRANGENSGSPTKSTSNSGHPQNHHQQSQHGGDDDVRLYPCPYCDRTFTSNVGYAGHMKVHKDRVHSSASQHQPASSAEANGEETVTTENEKTFVCRICDKKFTSGVQLGGHMRHHTAAMKAASASGVSTDVYDALHIDTDTTDVVEAHEDDQYICDTCDKTFVCKEELSDHVQYHVSDPAGTPSPGASFGKVARDGGLLCEYCDRPFNGVKSLKTHMYRYHRSVMMRTSRVEDKVYKCDSCNQKFTYLSELKKHTSGECYASGGGGGGNALKRSFSDDNMLRCEYCDQTFLLRCHLQKHLKSRCNAIDLRNEPAEPETMNGDSGGVGGAESSDILASKRVRKSTLVSSLYEYEPIGGPRRYSQKPVNLRAEFGDKPFECVYCEKCFGRKEDLLKHVRTHAESREFDDDEFNDYVNLHAEEHFVIQNQNGDEEHFIFEQYDDNEGYQCSECDETYRDKLQMIIHMSFHVNSKLPNGGYQSSLIIKADSTLLAPYKCKFCDERFINKSYRSRHLCKCHREEILQCEMCEKLFLHKETLKQHCKQHMIDTKYHCEYCQKCFTSKWFLKRHTRRHCAKRANAVEQARRSFDGEVTVDGYHCKSEKIETEQADSEIVVDHFIKEEMPAPNEVVVHMQMQSV